VALSRRVGHGDDLVQANDVGALTGYLCRVTAAPTPPPTDEALRARVAELCVEGWRLWDRFDATTLERPFHPFVAADYDLVAKALWPYAGEGLRFLEWGSATGVITIIADLLGYDAAGIELDSTLTATARELAERFGASARFAVGSFLPDGYSWRGPDGDSRTGTLGSGPSGYRILGAALDEFDVVFGYPWDGEIDTMLDLMRQFGKPAALLLIHSVSDGVVGYRNGTIVEAGAWLPVVRRAL